WRRLTWAMERVGAADIHDANMGMVVLNELQMDSRVEKREETMLLKLVDNVYARIDEGTYVHRDEPPRDSAHRGGAWFARVLGRIVT
ncbi:MAG: hypothetical protein ACTHWT_09260, partial [Brevibacterium yomogidense]